MILSDPILATMLTLIAGGVSANIALLFRLNAKVEKQNGSVAHLMREFDEHRQNDRDDFQRVFDKIERLHA